MPQARSRERHAARAVRRGRRCVAPCTLPRLWRIVLMCPSLVLLQAAIGRLPASSGLAPSCRTAARALHVHASGPTPRALHAPLPPSSSTTSPTWQRRASSPGAAVVVAAAAKATVPRHATSGASPAAAAAAAGSGRASRPSAVCPARAARRQPCLRMAGSSRTGASPCTSAWRTTCLWTRQCWAAAPPRATRGSGNSSSSSRTSGLRPSGGGCARAARLRRRLVQQQAARCRPRAHHLLWQPRASGSCCARQRSNHCAAPAAAVPRG